VEQRSYYIDFNVDFISEDENSLPQKSGFTGSDREW